MFFQPERSPYDLNWWMFGVHVRVHPWFWLFSAFLGWDTLRDGFGYLLLWVVCVFVSVLLHELGHVFVGRLFGADGHILLYSFGGLAIGSSNLANRWQRIAVYFAGPLAQLLLFGVLFWTVRSVDPDRLSPLAWAGLEDLWVINLFWPILNLLPIWPLDGGQISRDFLDWLQPRNGIRLSLGLSIVVAGLLAVNALTVTTTGHALPFLDRIPYLGSAGGFYMVLLFAALAFNSYQALQSQAGRKVWQQNDYSDRS